MVTPVTSDGSRSGVNWMREFVPSSVFASAFASTVLPVPGTSSSSTWPSLRSAMTTSLMTSRLPRIAWSTLSTSLAKASENQSACSCVTDMRAPLMSAARADRTWSPRVVADVVPLGAADRAQSARGSAADVLEAHGDRLARLSNAEVVLELGPAVCADRHLLPVGADAAAVDRRIDLVGARIHVGPSD